MIKVNGNIVKCFVSLKFGGYLGLFAFIKS